MHKKEPTWCSCSTLTLSLSLCLRFPIVGMFPLYISYAPSFSTRSLCVCRILPPWNISFSLFKYIFLFYSVSRKHFWHLRLHLFSTPSFCQELTLSRDLSKSCTIICDTYWYMGLFCMDACLLYWIENTVMSFFYSPYNTRELYMI